ncbi:MarR family winged helix-turn-helix transcriptional regulator [Nocardia sp. NPDC005746]|uniref:MarR family winged helix-turn-helix transcriptional regulator n=1 Tax=Nocardia sp. NPDC005746 TaxID=3157062 RepID=UPI003403C966
MSDAPKFLGYWLKRIDKTLEANFAAFLAAEGLLRRHWQTLHTLAGGPLDTAGLDAALSPYLDAHDPTAAPYVGALVDRGWVARDSAGTYVLTSEGVAAHAKLWERIRIQRAAATEGLSADDYGTLLDLLQRVAANVDAHAQTLRADRATSSPA